MCHILDLINQRFCHVTKRDTIEFRRVIHNRSAFEPKSVWRPRWRTGVALIVAFQTGPPSHFNPPHPPPRTQNTQNEIASFSVSGETSKLPEMSIKLSCHRTPDFSSSSCCSYTPFGRQTPSFNRRNTPFSSTFTARNNLRLGLAPCSHYHPAFIQINGTFPAYPNNTRPPTWLLAVESYKG